MDEQLRCSLAPRVGLEPTTTRLTAECSTIELSRIILESNVPSKLHTDLQTLRKFDSLCSSNDQTTFSISLLPKNGHLDYASLRLDEFAPQTFRTSLTRQPLQQADSLSAGSVLPFFSAFGQALDRLVAVRCTHYCASTPVLST